MPKKKDFILIIVLLCIALIGLIFVKFMQRESGAQVTIHVGNSVYGTYDLNKNHTIEVDDKDGYNKIIIEDSIVHMEEADCPDQYCVKHAPIHNNNESITCLPHRLVVEISGGDSTDIDIVSQ